MDFQTKLARFLRIGGALVSMVAVVLWAAGCGGGGDSTPTPGATPMTTPGDATQPAETPTSTADTTATATTEPSTEAVVTITPESGPPGSEVRLDARGLPAGTTLNVGMGRWESEYDVVGRADTSATGELHTSVRIPAYAEPDEQWVAVVATEDNALKVVSNIFEVTGTPEEGPQVTVTPRRGAPGSKVNVMAEGFPANTAVNLGAGRENSEYEILDQAQTDARGYLDAELTIPAYAETGMPWVIVVETQDHAIKAFSDTLMITGAGAPTATPAPGGMRVNIYLIALEDGGASGPEIGCGDSVVPVEVQIPRTRAVLRASLEALLAVDEAYYGQSGLYSALHNSDLRVGALNIANGRATIELTGDLQLGGVCDAPRVQAQIRQTALQFSTIDEVSATINGTPLAELQ